MKNYIYIYIYIYIYNLETRKFDEIVKLSKHDNT